MANPTLRQAVEALRRYNCDCLPAGPDGRPVDEGIYCERDVVLASDLTAALTKPDAGEENERVTMPVRTVRVYPAVVAHVIPATMRPDADDPADTPPPLSAEEWERLAKLADDRAWVHDGERGGRLEEKHTRLFAEYQAIAATCRARAERTPRCERAGKPCNTDTYPQGQSCPCPPCAAERSRG